LGKVARARRNEVEMIPARFIVEYPQRCLELIKLFEGQVRERDLVGSFSLLAAAAVFVIPYERMGSKAPLGRQERDTDLMKALKSLDKVKFADAPFWEGQPPGDWRLSRIVTEANDTFGWRDNDDLHPMAAEAKNVVSKSMVSKVLRVIRNALAHGNVVYLNADGFEAGESRVQYLGFLSRYEETPEEREKTETYRLVATTEDEFLRFVKQWAAWVSGFQDDDRLAERD
jgi:hypothetical protein